MPATLSSKLQPTRNHVYPKTWSLKPSPKQRMFKTSIGQAYLARLKEIMFHPFAYMKEERPTFHLTTKSTQHEPACSYKPKVRSCITRPLQKPAKFYTHSVRPFISTSLRLGLGFMFKNNEKKTNLQSVWHEKHRKFCLNLMKTRKNE